jgi:preprotein translocase subunit SecD
VLLFAWPPARLVAQSGFAIRAASSTPVAGWQQMEEPTGVIVWVGTTDRLTARDIERADRSTREDGRPAISVVFTTDGARKIAALSAAQRDKPIAILVDGKLIWAPVVRGVITNESLLSGGPEGLAPDDIERLLAGLTRR